MREKKQTEITVGFGYHTPSFIKKAQPYMEKSDVIFTEVPASYLPKKHFSKLWSALIYFTTKRPRIARDMITQLRKMNKEGKIIESWDTGGGTDANDIIEIAKENKEREEGAVQKIVEQLPRFEGKNIYVDAGAIHTPIYHMLKRRLEQQGISVKAVFLTKGMLEEPRINIRYEPDEERIRIQRFNTKSAKDDNKMDKMYDQSVLHYKKRDELYKKYRSMGLSRYDAEERAIFDMLKRRGRKGVGR